MEISDNSCRICNSGRLELFYDFSHSIESWQKVRYLRCKECGIVYEENIDDLDICRIYSGDIYSKYAAVGKYNIKSDEFARTIANDLKKEINIIENYVDKGRILDIGCARGYFSYFMQQNGWDAYGNDLSEYEIEIGKRQFGLKLFVGDLCELQFPDEYFDVITMWDVIEHLQAPLKRGISSPSLGGKVNNSWLEL